jgi:hypothetical protein
MRAITTLSAGCNQITGPVTLARHLSHQALPFEKFALDGQKGSDTSNRFLK